MSRRRFCPLWGAAPTGGLISAAMAQADQSEKPKIFHGVGKVTGIDAPSGYLSIDHEAIPGLMDAMEMQYQAKPAHLLEGLAVGDKVGFDVDGKTLIILAIKKIAPQK